MKRNSHTPGPWAVEENAGFSISNQDGWLFHDSDREGLPLEERKANARLIAAAPDLLFQVEQAKAILEVLDPENPAIRQIELTIKKAKGL